MTTPSRARRPRAPRAPRPLDAARLDELALAYVARFASSAAKVESYLKRKLRERGWEGEREPDTRAIVERFVELGYIDDEAFARARAGGLLRRGYGKRRVSQALHAAGIAEDIRASVSPDEAAARRAALAFASRRGFGPFGAAPVERDKRDKQIAAMLRAGHGFDAARALVDAPDIAAAAQWAAEA
jgi:regulatory protein